MYHYWATAPLWVKGLVGYLGVATLLEHIPGALTGIAELIAAIAALTFAFAVRRLSKAAARYLLDLGRATPIKTARPDGSDLDARANPIAPVPLQSAVIVDTHPMARWRTRDLVFVNRDLRLGAHPAKPRPLLRLIQGRQK